MTHPRAAGPRSLGFWLIVLAATANYTVLSASAPLLARAVAEVLRGDEALSGTLVAVTSATGALCMTLAGIAASRFGARAVTILSALVAVLGIGLLVATFTVPAVLASRVLYGIGNAGITVATTAWISASAPAGQRGRSLGYYGLSVWVGLALGPLLGENLYAARGNAAAWTGLLVVQALALLVGALVGRPRTARAVPATAIAADPAAATVGARNTDRARALLVVLRAPALVALAAWGAQGLIMTFLVQHLQHQGLPATGTAGAATVFLVFAASVVTARLATASLPDRLGPTITARWALGTVAAGLAMMALAPSFAWAAASAVVLGIGYSPLYPSLTLLSTGALPDALRPTGIGVFSAATSLGMAVGAFGGGALIAAQGSVVAFLVAASAQLLMLLALRGAPAPLETPVTQDARPR